MAEVLPCLISPAPVTRPPKASQMHWCPRHTPSTGARPAKRRASSVERPAPDGLPGPGEMTTRSGFSASHASTVVWSLRRTSTSSPSSARYW